MSSLQGGASRLHPYKKTPPQPHVLLTSTWQSLVTPLVLNPCVDACTAVYLADHKHTTGDNFFTLVQRAAGSSTVLPSTVWNGQGGEDETSALDLYSNLL